MPENLDVYRTSGMKKLRERLKSLGPPIDDYPYRKNGKYICKQYNLSEDEYLYALKFQCGRCSVCGEPGPVLKSGKRKHLCIDHCHDTGRFRDLKCYHCNLAMGFVRNRSDIAKHLSENAAIHKEFLERQC